jgi:hypothetical protein
MPCTQWRLIHVRFNPMNTVAVILNAVLMALLGFVSGASQFKVDNVLMYPRAYNGLSEHFPAMTALAIRLRWLCWAVPLIWLALAIFLIVRMPKADPARANAIVQVHTSATLILGVLMLAFFVLAGVFPFVSFVAGMK